MSIHKFAEVDPSAKIDSSVSVGAFASIGPNVEIGANSVVESHAVIHKNTNIGNDNYISSFVSLGGASQSKHDNYQDDSSLIIGNNNNFHECCCINRGSIHDSKATKIGNNNIFMAYTHVGHDCEIFDHVVMVNQSTLAGHVVVNSHAVIGYSSAVRQFCQIGKCSFISEGAAILKDVLPFVLVRGNPVRVVGINKIGLSRLEFSEADIAMAQECFRIVFRRNNSCAEALEQLAKLSDRSNITKAIVEMLDNSSRGLVR